MDESTSKFLTPQPGCEAHFLAYTCYECKKTVWITIEGIRRREARQYLADKGWEKSQGKWTCKDCIRCKSPNQIVYVNPSDTQIRDDDRYLIPIVYEWKDGKYIVHVAGEDSAALCWHAYYGLPASLSVKAFLNKGRYAELAKDEDFMYPSCPKCQKALEALIVKG